MGATNYQAVVFDLDGTAIPNRADGMPSPGLIQAVDDARGKLHLFAATGRPISIALPVIQALGLTDQCVIAGGTTIIDPASGRVLHRAEFTLDQLDAITQICRGYNYKLMVDDQTRDESMSAANRPLQPPASIIMMGPVISSRLTRLVASLSGIPGVFATSAQGWSGGHIVHITTATGMKEHGIASVLKSLGLAREHVIGVGDSSNDIHLFAAVGHRVAMGNASPELKSVADEIAPTVDDDGLAWVINKYSP
jgi:hydroxymethylpyrimidine pyrophosphatase-like HAD family hydrolase